MQTSTILLALAGIFLVACNASFPSIRDANPDLERVVKSISSGLDIYLKAGFTRQARRLKNTPVSLQLGDLFFHLDDNTGILLKNVRLPSLPALTAQSIQTDLEYLNAKIQLEAASVVFQAEYEITNNEYVGILPVTSTGELTATLKDVQISGVAGLAIADYILKATNMDIKYEPANVTVEVTDYEKDEKISSQVTVTSMDQSLLNKIKAEITYRISDVVRAQLNILLNQQYLEHLFLGDMKMLSDFKEYAAKFTVNCNALFDALLKGADVALKDLGIDPIAFPDIYESFSKRIFLIRWHGSFTANKGGVNGLASLHRYKDVSMSVENDVVTVFGGIGLEQLSVGYSYYKAEFMGIGPTGTFRVGIQDPAIFLKLSVKLGLFTAEVEDFKFQHVGQLKVDITGLDLLKWLIEQIANWVSGAFHDLMDGELETKIKAIIDKVLKDLDLKPFFPPKM